MLKASDLRVKDVININDGKRLGQLVDVEINNDTGRIEAIVVPNPGRILGLFGGGNDRVIPWDKIVKIGPDCILVNIET